ncbi:T9SS type A sorting domain-containing protein [Mangrovimonas sp. AS39]|uniref:LamG-like jellyroll fold domain-containing protein n=1 Tax=Mangrovimonas futianensis TaxID=2895523 RepID=UPI001E36AC9B|nr:LamG-like jellyroll fold domain-containing protein [Mangrovimonas futianensis]MCF1192369.1 T9SS type A sorting domain-containing protein [Mangrovimonas futianensis]MCF1195882.1 T9SS type A sorting domain-containing protein [Mangrovimonas futianensis]
MIKKLPNFIIKCSLFLFGMGFFIFPRTIHAQTSLSFDGSNDYIQTPFTGVLGDNDRTFEAWIYVSSSAPSSNLAILDYGHNDVGDRNTFVVGGDRSLKYISGGTNANITTAANVIPTATWTHVAFVLDNSIGYLYVNGAQEGTGSLSTVNTTSGFGNLRIGQRVTGGSIPFNGLIDDVRVWNVARTDTEIQSAMYVEMCANTLNLVANYQLNEGTAGSDNTGITAVIDLVEGNDGVLNNFALTGTTSNYVEGAPFITLEETTLTAFQADASYQWIDCDNGGAYIDGATEQSFTPEVAGTYAVEITLDGCMTTSECMEVTSLGIDTSVIDGIKVYPNPTSDFVTISLNEINNYKVTLVTITGQIIGTYSDNQSRELSIDLQDNKSGIYFLNIEVDGIQTKTIKIVRI